MWSISIKTLLRVKIILVCLILIFSMGCGNQREVKFEQVYTGANGPRQGGVQYFSAALEVDNSWVKTSLSGVDYRHIMSEVDFSRHVLVAFSFGEVDSFSGKIQIVSIYQYTGAKQLPINIRVRFGVLNDSCNDNIKSFPFALAVMEKPVGFQSVGGSDVASFEDGCS